MLALFPLIKLRNAGSRMLARRYEQTDWEPPVPNSLPEMADFCKATMEYKADPARGLLDHIQPVKHMNWQLKESQGKLFSGRETGHSYPPMKAPP